MIKTQGIVDQLCDVYEYEETWHKQKMGRKESLEYHEKLLHKGNILLYEELGVLLGYVEFWRVDFEQLGRIVCDAPFSAYIRDVSRGPICYVANIWITKEKRGQHIIKYLKNSLLLKCFDCDYFIGQRRTKNKEPLTVHNRSQFISNLGGE